MVDMHAALGRLHWPVAIGGLHHLAKKLLDLQIKKTKPTTIIHLPTKCRAVITIEQWKRDALFISRCSPLSLFFSPKATA
jgi:hypothetical protein